MKRKKNGKTLFGAAILLLMVVLAGTVAFADYDDTCGGVSGGGSPSGGNFPTDGVLPGTYFPMVIQKVWKEGDDIASRPSSVVIDVGYYDSDQKAKHEMITLTAAEGWKKELSLDHEYAVRGEYKEGSTLEKREALENYKYTLSASDEMDSQGRYTLYINNWPAHSVTYQWVGEDIPDGYKDATPGGEINGQAGLPGIAKYYAGAEVEIHTRTYQSDGGKYGQNVVSVNGQLYHFKGWDTAYRRNDDGSIGDKDSMVTTQLLSGNSNFTMPDHNLIITGEWEILDNNYVSYEWSWPDDVPSDKVLEAPIGANIDPNTLVQMDQQYQKGSKHI